MTAVSIEQDQGVRDQVHRLMPDLWKILKDLVRDRSIVGDDKPPLRQTAETIVKLLKDAGIPGAKVDTVTHGGATSQPLVLADHVVDPGLRTVLLYSHYDVQPVGTTKWIIPDPFDPQERKDGPDTRLYGRGAADDKSGIVMHLGAIKALLANGQRLPVNLKIVFEGEEETGKSVLDGYLAANPADKRFQADVVVIADTGNVRLGVPTLTRTLRGIVAAKVVVETLTGTKHSGMYGGPAPDAFMALVQMLARLQDKGTGDVTVPGLQQQDYPWPTVTEETFRKDAGVLDGVKLIGTDTIQKRLYGKPSINVVGLTTGIQPADQPKSVLCPRAEAVVSLRLAPNQNPDKAYEALSRHLEAAVPWGVKHTITKVGEGTGFIAKDGKYNEVIEQSLKVSYGAAKVEKSGQGGSIPLVNAFGAANPNADIVLWGTEEPRANIHGENESVSHDELEHMTLAEAFLLKGLATDHP
jgi:cysteinylglycine-S-conjugate dipeptidase